MSSWKSILYEKNEKYICISKFLKFLDFWILDSAWSLTHDCTFLVMESLRHVRSHTKFQLILAINTAFTRGGLNQTPPQSNMELGPPHY